MGSSAEASSTRSWDVVRRPAMSAPASAYASRLPDRVVGTTRVLRHSSGPSQHTAATESGTRMYRTGNGQMVELPPDMTHEEASRLEVEATAAEKQLGKGPPPRPVPEVKILPKKAAKQDKFKPKAKGRTPERGREPAASKAGGAATALLKAVGRSPVAQYLAAKGAPVLLKGIGMLQKLKQNEQTHDNAAEKLKQSKQAVVIPPSEGQSKSNAGQVNIVSGRPAPIADENKAKQKLQDTLSEHIPRTIEDVDNFKRDKKAQHMGADVMKVVQGDKNAVISTFADMEHTPAPAPLEHTPEALPPQEVAPSTATMNLGQDAVAPLQKEHTDVSNYTKEADSKLKEEGVTQEQLDMVDSGDLAEANKEKKGMEKAALTEPLAVQKFARQESERVDKDLKLEEKKGRDGLKATRKAGLGATAQKQKGTKSAIEKKREEVAGKINGIYTTAQGKVKKKLADLEMQSMKRFDAGNAKATKEFEDNVKREIDAFKADRYSGWFGWARKAKDWLLGLDDLPGVKAIFERNRTGFVDTMNKLVGDITADNQRVIQECKDELANAKKTIQEFVDKLDPGLKDIGKKAAAEMNAKLNELDQFVAKKEQELQDKLKEKQQAAIKAIDEKIEKMKEAMSGALAKLGKLLLWAAKKFFTWALEKFGFSLADIESIINKGAAVLKAIFTQPIRFVKNLVNAASTGFKNFGKNFLTHLKNAIFEWLTGSLEGIQLPSSWDLKGIVSVALQILGLTWSNIRTKMVKLMGEPVVKGLETTFTLVRTLIKEGPIAAWEQLKEMAGEVKQAFIEAVQDFIKIKIAQKAIETIVSMFVPGAGIIRAIIGIYDTIVFFIQKAKDIMQMIGNFLGSIAEIAAGNISAAAAALEHGLARALTLVIDFLARFLRLSGITKKIQEAIQKIRNKVDAVLDKVAHWIADKAKKLFGSAKAAVGKVAGAAKAAFSWAFARTTFKEAGGKGHSIYIEGEDAPRLMVASDPKAAEAFLNWYLDHKSDAFKKKKDDLIKQIRKQIKEAKEIAKSIADLKKKGDAWKNKQQEMLQKNVELSGLLSKLVGDDPSIAEAIEKYKLEGLTGTYGSMPKPPGDDFTADHQPQAAILTAATKFRFFSKTGELAERAEGRARAGYAINLYKVRHAAGATYGKKGGETKESFLARVKPLVKDKEPSEQRKLVIKEIRSDLRRDVAAMKSVVRAKHDSPTWADVMKKAEGDKKGQHLVGEIRERIIAGEDQIANQDLESLAS